jgi:SAM-dependent methyltransferase
MKGARMVEDTGKNAFFEHFGQDKPTKFGSWLVDCMRKQIFEFAQLKRGNSVLEIGPGRGVFANICLSEGLDYWAIEPNERMAQALKEQGANVIQAIVPPVPDMERRFDAVVMINVMEHMNSMQDALQVSREVKGVLKPKGKFVICSPDYVNWRYHFFLSDFSHNYVTTWRRIQGLLINAGFEEVVGGYQSGPFRGVMCFLVSALTPWLPFGRLTAMFPKSTLLRKLYKLQTPFLRKVLILGEKPA